MQWTGARQLAQRKTRPNPDHSPDGRPERGHTGLTTTHDINPDTIRTPRHADTSGVSPPPGNEPRLRCQNAAGFTPSGRAPARTAVTPCCHRAAGEGRNDRRQHQPGQRFAAAGGRGPPVNHTIDVRTLDVMAEARWSWNSPNPTWWHRPHGIAANFDPFPAYRHDLAVAEAAARHVEALVPLTWPVEIYVADREELGRSNGFSTLHDHGHYEGDNWVKDPVLGLVVLSGKRVPPHPALTRYLVAHEIGHHVEWMLNQARGAKNIQSDELITAYAELRGLPEVHAGSGGRWHNAAAEIFACDFRTIVCGVEPEYWPHPGVPRPEDAPADLTAWWATALQDLADLDTDTPAHTG